MARLADSNGVVVSVSDEKAKRLIEQGYKPVSESKAPAKKAASPKKSD